MASYIMPSRADSDEWIGNLQCYGIDFRDLQSLELFCDWVKNRHSRLDAVVNNACQTIRRPAQYYSHLMNAECTPLAELSPKERGLLQGNEEFRSKIGVRYLEVQQDSLLPGVSGAGSARGKASIQTIEELEEGVSAAPSTTEASQRDVVSGAAGGAAAGADGGQECNKTAVRARGEGGNKGLQDAQVELGVGSGSAKEPGVSVVNADSLGQGSTLRVGTAAEMSQRHVLQEDAHRCTEAFPSRAGGGAVLDINEQQLDLRTNNSWMLKLHEVMFAFANALQRCRFSLGRHGCKTLESGMPNDAYLYARLLIPVH